MQLLNSCWYWAGIHQESGYGYLWTGKKLARAHRAVYEALVGEIPEGLVLDHLCKNKICVNPEHLEAVTQAENMRRFDYSTRNVLRKTHCRNGHEFTGRTRTRNGKTEQLCVICKSEQDKRYKAKLRELIK